jgi:hypothetical protein
MEANGQFAKEASLERRLHLVLLINTVFVAISLTWWKEMALLMADPIQWATWQHVSPRPGYFEYPIILLWALPLVGCGAAWVMKKGRQLQWAVWVATFPLLYISTLVACFHLIPKLMR